MSRRPLVVAVLLVLACNRPEAPASATATAPSPPPAVPTAGAAEPVPASAAQGATPGEKAWKVKPTALSVIKADPPSYLDRPTLVFVAVKPADYFNYGYNGARDSHFAFEMRSVENGRPGPERLFGYAARSWARPFFEAVNRQRGARGKEYAAATLAVAYSKRRYDGKSAEHIEILAAEVGEKFDMDPQTVVAPASAAPAAAAAMDAARNSARNAVRQQQRAKQTKGSEGDCGIWRQINEVVNPENRMQLPRFCKAYPPGSAERGFDMAHKQGLSQEGQLCFSYKIENGIHPQDEKGDLLVKAALLDCAAK